MEAGEAARFSGRPVQAGIPRSTPPVPIRTTVSILAALDLQDGRITARVEDRHRRVEFIGLQSDLNAKYPRNASSESYWTIIPRTLPKRRRLFSPCTPSVSVRPDAPAWPHGRISSRLCSVKWREAFCGISGYNPSTNSKLVILKGIAEINAAPVAHRWKKLQDP